MTLHDPGAMFGEPVPSKALTAARDSFSLNASVACDAHQRDKLERLCRYVSRGPISLDRLSIDGQADDRGRCPGTGGLCVGSRLSRDTEGPARDPVSQRDRETIF